MEQLLNAPRVNPRLDLDGKFFVDEGKKGEDQTTRPIPDAIHLLQEHDEKLKSYENELKSATPSAAPGDQSNVQRRADSETAASIEGRGGKKHQRRLTPTFTDSSDSEDLMMSEATEAATREELRPVKKYLQQLRLPGGDMPREEKVLILKVSLARIGEHIRSVLKRKEAQSESRDCWRRRLWTFVTFFWPKYVKASTLEGIHAKMIKDKNPADRPSSSKEHISTKLDPSGSNFSPWQYRIEILLRSRDLWMLIDGTEGLISTSYTPAEWQVRDASARLCIIDNIPDELLWIVQKHETAAAQWNALSEHFLSPAPIRVRALSRDETR